MEFERFEIDLDGVTDKEELHERIKEILPCPDYYGNNLDGLYDILTEQDEGWEIVFCNWQEFAEEMPKYMDALERMCEDAQEESEYLEIRFE